MVGKGLRGGDTAGETGEAGARAKALRWEKAWCV